jgi:hypothetical protein
VFSVLTCGVLVAMVLNVLGTHGTQTIERTRAHIAADAAALAAVSLGEEGAAHLATVNGADLISFRRLGPLLQSVEVWVQYGRQRAVSYASEAR